MSPAPGACLLAVVSIEGNDSQALGDAAPWLTATEAHRLAQMQGLARRQFLTGHWLARQLLAAQFGGDPAQDWPIESVLHQPPRLLPQAQRADIFLSISHSASWVACAVSATPVGIDLEWHSPRRSLDRLMDAILTHSERMSVLSEDGCARLAKFYCYWTVKEAWFKRQAMGITPRLLASVQVNSATEKDRIVANVWHARELTLACIKNASQPVLWWKDGVGFYFGLQPLLAVCDV